MNFLPRLIGVGSVKLIRCGYRSVWNHGAYDGEGKTTVTILNVAGECLMIDQIRNYGFLLNNKTFVMGPMIIFPKSIVSWQIANTDEITEDSLALFKVLDPMLDLLIFGLDQTYARHAPLMKVLKEFCKKIRTPVEILPVHQAATTYNFLNAENRYVAAALLPPKLTMPYELTALRKQLEREALNKPEPIDSK